MVVWRQMHDIVGEDAATTPCSICGADRSDGAWATPAGPAGAVLLPMFICTGCCYQLEEVAGQAGLTSTRLRR